MVEFCPECSSLLRKQILNSKPFLACKCGFEKDIMSDIIKIEETVQKKKKDLEEN